MNSSLNDMCESWIVIRQLLLSLLYVKTLSRQKRTGREIVLLAGGVA